jgi:hypothetical protein
MSAQEQLVVNRVSVFFRENSRLGTLSGVCGVNGAQHRGVRTSEGHTAQRW